MPPITPPQSLQIIPLDCLTMIEPHTARSVPDSANDAPFAWQQHNDIWDGQRITLAAAIGETVAFQLILLPSANTQLRDIRIQLKLPHVKQVAAWRAWHIWDVPEVAVPLDGVCPFDIPTSLELEAEQLKGRTPRAWSTGVEFTLPRDLPAGTLEGSVHIDAASGMSPVEIPLQLTAHPFALPLRPSYLIEMNSYGDWTRWLDNTPGTFLTLQRMMHDHRTTFLQVPYRQSGNLPSPYLSPEVTFNDAGECSIDWSRFDADMAGLFDGSAFSDGLPVSHFILPLAYNTPIRFALYQHNRNEYIRRQIVLRQMIVEHLRDRGWTQTIFQEFHNENITNGAITSPWFLDEPRTAEDMQGHDLFLNIFDAAVSRNDEVKLHYRIDISAWQRLGETFHQFAPRFDDWIVSRDPDFLNPDCAPMFRQLADKKKGLFLEYGEMIGFLKNEKPTNWSYFCEYLRKCRRLNTDGFEQWIVDMWAGPTDEGKWNTAKALTYSSAGGMRDFIWPGHIFGYIGALPSLRLKALRESMNLFDYASRAIQQHPALTDEIGRSIENMDVNRSADHHTLKARLAKWQAAS